MNSAPHPTLPIEFDFEALPTEAVDLSPEIIDRAVELSTQINHPERQWQTYLNALALYGFEQWLDSRAADFTINWQECSLLQPAAANAIEAVANLKVNDFNLCLIATGSLTDEEVTLPRAIVDLPEFVPHFYVLVEVQEELEIATVRAFLTYEQLSEQRESVNLVAEEDWTYQVPLTWFASDPDRLLLYLECLEASAIPLPVIPSVSEAGRDSVSRVMQLARMRSDLQALLPQLHSPERQLWQILTWEQGTAVLTSPELLEWLYQLQQQPRETETTASVGNHLSDILQLLTQRAVNVGCWLSEQMDDLARELSWVLLPSSSFASAFALRLRTPEEEFKAIVTQLRQAGVEIPPEARGAYRDLRLAGMPLRLYAVTWSLLSESVPEWTLLLVLGATPGTNLPASTQLRISDRTGILVEQGVNEQQRDSYFYTSVIGTWDEKFIVTVSLRSGIEQTLPPFSFNPEQG